MKKMTALLLTLAATLFAGEVYFSNDTISYGNKSNWAEATGDFYPFESKLINSTDDTIFLDSTTVDSVTNSGFTSCNGIDTLSQSLIWAQMGVNAGLFKKEYMTTARTAIHDEIVLFPLGSINANYDHCQNGDNWKHLAGTDLFDEHVVRIWVHTTTHYRRNGLAESVPLVIGGYMCFYNGSVSTKSPKKITPIMKTNSKADGYIYNMRGQIVGTQTSTVNNLATGVVLQKNRKMNTQSYQRAE